jgi:hypothetical protein
MIIIKQTGTFNKTEKFLKNVSINRYKHIFEKYGKEGVNALASVTPVDSGVTASSWGYKITNTSKGISISWTNSNIVNGVPIAIILQYGHGTRNGGYVQGRDYINPAIRPIFDRITNDIWKEVQQL